MAIRTVNRFVRSLVALAAVVAVVGPAASQPLEPDPEMRKGRLSNGLEYIIIEHANPPERANMFLHISSGSLNETDRTRGVAHYLEHMVFNGGENIPPGEVIPYFESLGMSFGQHLNAFTSFDQTTYILSLPDVEAATFEKGFLFFEDVLFGTLLLPEEIEKERGVIMEELRTGKGPEQRIRDQIFERLAPGSTFGRRLPIGTEETIRARERRDFQGYYGTYYVPSNATLMIAADAAPAKIEKLVEENFDIGERAAEPEDKPVGIEPYETMRAIVATDDELTSADIQILNIDEPRPAVTNQDRFREQLVEAMAARAVNRRFEEKINDDKVAFTSGGAFVSDLFNAMRYAQVSASGEPDEWRAILEDLGRELRRARLHGFTAREIENVRKEIISQAERRAERADSLPARVRLQQLNAQIAAGATPISADRNLELTRGFAPGISAEEINDAVRGLFRDDEVTVVAVLPSSADVPTEEELLSLSKTALVVEPGADIEREAVTALMERLPEPGRVTEPVTHEATGVTSAWLESGARVHHRAMDIQEDQATVTITLAGGQIEETAENRGITEAAVIAFDRQATGGLSTNDINDLMAGKKVSVGGGAGPDTVSVSVSGKPSELETGLQLAHLLLTDPVIERAAFEQWKQERIRQIEQSMMVPQGQLQRAMAQAMLPEGEVRQRPLTVEQVEAVTLGDAQAWLDRIVASAPMEVAIVGDIERKQALDLAGRYLASLPERSRISDRVLTDLRDIDRPEGPRRVMKEVETQTPVSIVMAGSFGTNLDAVRDRRALNVATQVLTTRLIERVREEEAQVYSIQARSVSSGAYPGYGLIFAAAPTGPGNTEQLVGVIHEMFAAFASEGPSESEVATAKDQVLNTWDEQVEQPAFWTDILSTMAYRGMTLDEVSAAPAMYTGFRAREIQDAFAKYYGEDTRLTVGVSPKGTGDTPAPGGG